MLKTYTEDVSGSGSEPRPVLDNIMALVTKGIYQVIVVKDDSRFSRHVPTLIKCVQTFKAFDIKLMTIYDTDLTQNLTMTTFHGAISQDVILKGIESQKMMLQLKSKQGGLFGEPPLGYKINHKILENGKIIKCGWVIDEPKALIVTGLFNKFINEEHPLLLLAKEYNMSRHSIYYILHNKKYCGIFDYTENFKVDGKIIRRVKHSFRIKEAPKIISEAVYNQAQSLFRKKGKPQCNTTTNTMMTATPTTTMAM